MTAFKPKWPGKNPKVDRKMIARAEALEKKLPKAEQTRRGADFKLAPPLGGQLLSIARRARGI